MAKLKDLVVRTLLSNSDEHMNMGDQAFDTNDYVFLESEDEAKFLTDEEIITEVTDYTLMNGGWHYDGQYGGHSAFGRCTWYWMRSSYKAKNPSASSIDSHGFFDTAEVHNLSGGICPTINLNLSAVLASKKLRGYLYIKPGKNKVGRIVYHTMRFGEYPQGVASESDTLEELFKANKLKPTGKVYIGYIKKDGRFQQNREFEYNGKKYVRVIANTCEGYIKYSNFSNAKATGSPIWAEVQPLRWEIRNWGDLPTKLNPGGFDEAKTITLRSEKALFAGVPFYPSKDDHVEYTMWQNSPIRAILNGYDLQKEIDAGNGNKQYKASTNFNFSGNSFLDSIDDGTVFADIKLEDSDTASNTASNSEDKSPKTKPNPYGFVYDNVDNDDLLMMYIQSGTSVFLHGPSGVGKSSRVKQIDPTATRITLRPQMNPEEIDGTLDRETGNYIAPLWYTQLCEKCKAEPDRKHVLFIDELTNVKPTVQSLVYSIVLDHAGKDGLWPLPDNAVVVAAGNETADSSVANNLPGALHRRFCHIYYQIDKQAWLDWAMGVSKVKKQKYEPSKKEDRAKIHPAILTYIMSRGDDILNQDLDEENPKIVTDPRKWEIASNVLYETKNPNALVPAIGEELTADFVDFVQNIPVSVNDVVDGKYDKRDFIEMAIDKKMSTILGLLTAKEEQLKTVRAFIQNNLGKELLATYDSLWIRNNPERAQIIAENSLENAEENNNNHTL